MSLWKSFELRLLNLPCKCGNGSGFRSYCCGENMSDRSTAAMYFGLACWITLMTSCASGRQPSVSGEALFRLRQSIVIL